MKLWDKMRGFVEDTIKEMKRVSWPSRQEVEGTTLVVVVAVLVVSVYLGVVDAVLGWVSRWMFGLGGASS